MRIGWSTDILPGLGDNLGYSYHSARVKQLCAERQGVGQLPACVEASGGKILFGDLEDPNSTVRQALSANYSIRRKPNLGTQPGVYYLI